MGSRQLTTAERLAIAFHDTYEKLAPQHGYKTREESAKPWDEVPAENKDLMIATVEALLDAGVIRVPTDRLLGVQSLTYAATIPCEEKLSGGEPQLGGLPMWADRDGRLRIAIGKSRPRYAGDYDQLIVSVADLLRGIGVALAQAPENLP